MLSMRETPETACSPTRATMIVSIILGMGSRAVIGTETITNNDAAFLYLIDVIFGPLWRGLTGAAIYSAIMSTAAGLLLAAAAALSNDIIARVKPMEERKPRQDNRRQNNRRQNNYGEEGRPQRLRFVHRPRINEQQTTDAAADAQQPVPDTQEAPQEAPAQQAPQDAPAQQAPETPKETTEQTEA